MATQGLMFLLYFTVGLCGYYTFGNNVSGNVLNSFVDADAAATFVSVGCAVYTCLCILVPGWV